ncbi:multidrug resistance protein homolog 65-like [Contarinia nasturtii]|uniref:multidrug resistance protein homolog 65-like n=1 Tax=Contarinia nasturtii TaxID=265458 RepID=UPI0012D40848|nr:multidrug resistance protein homolog 65-like [Contarinia nasturtii]
MTSNKYSCFSRWNKKDGSKTINYFSLYRYATRWDLFVIVIGVICTFLKAFAMPWTIIVYGEFTSLLVERMYGTGTSSPTWLLHWLGGGKRLTNATIEVNRQEIMNDSVAYCIHMLMATMWQFIFGILCVDCFNRTSIRQVTRLRVKYFESLMRQDIAWYDCSGSKTNFTIRITEDIEKIKSGIAEDVSHFLNLMFSFVIFVSISFIYGWQLTIIVISYLPLVFFANIFIGKLQAKAAENELDAYAKAANVVEETLNAIRTVLAFGGENVEIERYTKLLYPSREAAKRKGLYSSISDGVTRFLFFISCALSFWIGVQWVFRDRDSTDKDYTPASLLIIFFSLVSAADNIAETTPFLLTFSVARGSAKGIFAVIDRISSIDPIDNSGEKLKPNDINGSIEFRNVHFNYPSRDVQILQNFNVKIKHGETVALVGKSGSGKSTCIQLLQRFYDPDKGAVLLNDRNLKSLNIHSLRSTIAIVSQEPVLFSTTIKENIRYGNPSATDRQVIDAAQMSGAHDFVSELSLGYDTLVNDSQLSGGQKQRIAIARALVQNPKILLLDEATSALDYQSEKYIQKTLDRVSKGRTTIVVSHRLSALKSVQRILYIEKGRIVEEGTHEELFKMKGRYYEMVKTDNNHTKQFIRNRKSTTDSSNNEQSSDKENDFLDETSNANSNESLVDHILEKDEKVEEEVKYVHNFIRILKLAKPDWPLLAIAVLSSFIVGSAFPLFSVVFAEVYGALSVADLDEALNEVSLWCVVFLGLGIFIFIGAMCQTYFFTRAGANLTQRIRSNTFEAMLKQECGWFDENSVGSLSSRLTSDAANIQTAIGYPLSLILQAISTFATGIIVSFMSSMKLSLVCLLSVPFLFMAVFLESKHLAKSAISEKQAIEAGTKIASESIASIRTVASLRQENQMISRFVSEMERVEKLALKKIYFRGFVNSFSTAVPLLAYAVALYQGGVMVANDEIHYKNIVRVSEAMLYGTLYMCQTLVFVPTISIAFIGAHGIFKIIDRKPLITSIQNSNTSTEMEKSNDIDFKDISFRYPTRPTIQVLDNFNLNIAEAKTIALVGKSGSGKSTCIQLLQRLYDPEHGHISIGKSDISKQFSITELRKRLSIVSQEPTLFDRTIAENIAYGDNSRIVTMDEIIQAAKVANVHNFVIQLPQGYETNIGSKATQISGGQKQRIAIARALIRNPKILLLDEATSALDLQSEQVVQQALDSAQSGRTCIIIAHRLTTIQNADLICVVQNGMIVEAGTHCELLASLNGAYTRLYNAQK